MDEKFFFETYVHPFLRRKFKGYELWLIFIAVFSFGTIAEWYITNLSPVSKPFMFLLIFLFFLINLLNFLIFSMVFYWGVYLFWYLPLFYFSGWFGFDLSIEWGKKFSKLFCSIFAILAVIILRVELLDIISPYTK